MKVNESKKIFGNYSEEDKSLIKSIFPNASDEENKIIID